jgi:ADP-heptose:LPS heptosyltransferase
MKLQATKEVKYKEILQNTTSTNRANPTFIPIHLTGGIGDVLMSLDAVDFLSARYEIAIYTHHIEAFKYFRKEVPVFKVIPDYDWCLEFNTIAKFHRTDSFSGFLTKQQKDLFFQQQDMFRQYPKLEKLVKHEFNKFFLLSMFGKEMKWNRRDFPMRCLGFTDIIPFKKMDRADSRSYITIHDGFDVHNSSIVSGRATKTWKWEYWNTLVKELKRIYPEYEIIQLGSSTARPIDGVDKCLVNETTIVEAFDIISHSILHIDGDSGLSHAAARMNIPCIVLWGPTPNEFYGYLSNINLRSTKTCSGSCYGVKENWNDKCVLGYNSPKCMDDIAPELVIKAVKEIFIETISYL